jgi:DNA mismatch repair protein MutS
VFAETNRLTELADARELADEMARVRPAEVLVSEEAAAVLGDTPGLVLRDGYAFLYDQAHYALKEQFQVQALDGFGCAGLPAAVSAAGALVHYLRHELRRSLAHVRRLTTYHRSEFMVLDAATQANLELVESRGGGRDTSLLGALDRTKTPMGGRRLRDWVLHPLCNLEPLVARQEAVGRLLGDPAGLQQLRDLLGGVRDVERTVGRLTQTGGTWPLARLAGAAARRHAGRGWLLVSRVLGKHVPVAPSRLARTHAALTATSLAKLSARAAAPAGFCPRLHPRNTPGALRPS